jgi:hypothetical protein
MATSQAAGVRISYDKMADVLYLSIGEPQAGIDEEVSEGVYIRLHPQTDQPVGLMVIDFEKRFSQPLEQAIPIDLARFFAPA